MQFEVRALGANNQLSTAWIEASDVAQAHALATQRGLFAVSVAPAGNAAPPRMGLGRRQSEFGLTMFSQDLLALLEAGLSLSEALEALAEREQNASTQQVLTRLMEQLRQGTRLSDAMAEQVQHFPALFVGIVRAAEHTSDLPRALGRYIDYRARLDQLRSRLISASIYPAILCVVGLAVTLFLIGHVVPSFASVYADSGRPMPWMSRLLMDAGAVLLQNRTLAIALLAAAVGAGVWSVRRITSRGGWVALFKRVPGIAGHARMIELSRLYLTLGMLMEGGISVRTALEMILPALSPDTATHVTLASRDIGHGDPLSVSFERHTLTTPIALRLLRVGERTGQLGLMLTRAAQFHEGESARWIERFSKVFEPALMAIIGLIIGAIVVLLYLPIFDLAGSLQ